MPFGATGFLEHKTDKKAITRSRIQGDSVFKKMAQPHEQLFFLNYKKMET